MLREKTGLSGRSSKLGFVGGIGVRLRPTDYAVTLRPQGSSNLDRLRVWCLMGENRRSL